MAELHLETHEHRDRFRPGDPLDGLVSWNVDDATAIEVRLFWYTEGKGDQDVEVVEVQRFDRPAANDAQVFSFTMPIGPLSYGGRLISVMWAIEAVALPSGDSTRIGLQLVPH